MEQPKDNETNHSETPKESVKAGAYFLCTCGKSTYYPHCDGSHKGTGQVPKKVVITQDSEVCWQSFLNED